MKHIGIVGVTAEGAALCYKTICSESATRLSQNTHPEITLHEFPSHLYFEKRPDWKAVADLFLQSIEKLKKCGAAFAILPSNTAHYAFNEIQKSSPIPVISIIESTVDACKQKGYQKVAVLGTKLTMTGDLYKAPLEEKGIAFVVPSEESQERIHDVIYNHIIPAKVSADTEKILLDVVRSLEEKGVDAVILGCTELPIVLGDHNSPIPTVDTTRLLAIRAVDYALE